MQTYVLKRLAAAVPVLFGLSIGIFVLIRLIPGDAVTARLAQAGNLSAEDLRAIRAQLGLDIPIWEQYAVWLKGLARGDLGNSLVSGRPAVEELAQRIPITIEILLLSMAVALVIAIPLGVAAAVSRNSVTDYIIRLVSVAAVGIPDFWLATIIILYLSIWFHWSPPVGYARFWEDPGTNVVQIVIPVLIMGVRLSGTTMRMTRSALLEVLRDDYIRTAWAKGLAGRVVIIRHALKNAMIPVITVIGSQIAVLMGGAVVIETIFGIPGVGRLTFDAINQRDYVQIQANIMFIGLVMVATNLIVDVAYSWFDPRIRFR